MGSTLTLGTNVTIDGTGHTVVVDGGRTSDGNGNCTSGGVTVFTVNSGVTATINLLTIQHGNSASVGGGIDSRGTLTVTKCTVAFNRATTFDGGGRGAPDRGLPPLDHRTGNRAVRARPRAAAVDV